jgi:hypothetical protein
MTITRRNVLLGATATAALLPIAARAQTSEVVIGIIYPFSGGSAQQGVDAQKAYEIAAEIINKDYDFDLPLAKGEGLPGLGGAKVRLSSRRTIPRRACIAAASNIISAQHLMTRCTRRRCSISSMP